VCHQPNDRSFFHTTLFFALCTGGIDKEVVPRVAYLKPGSVAQRSAYFIFRNVTALSLVLFLGTQCYLYKHQLL